MNIPHDPITGKPLSEKDLAVLKIALTGFRDTGPRRFVQKGYPPEVVHMLNEIVGVAFSAGFVLGLSCRDNPEHWETQME